MEGALLIWLKRSLPSGFSSNASSSGRPPLAAPPEEQPHLTTQTLCLFLPALSTCIRSHICCCTDSSLEMVASAMQDWMGKRSVTSSQTSLLKRPPCAKETACGHASLHPRLERRGSVGLSASFFLSFVAPIALPRYTLPTYAVPSSYVCFILVGDIFVSG